jgi:hypothetical protein
MKTYDMNRFLYADIWDKIEQDRESIVSHRVFERWLCLCAGLSATYERPSYDGDYYYRYIIRDEKKFMVFLLKWT